MNYFDKPLTNAYTESLNNIIRSINRNGRGYSFDVLRAKILFAKGAQRKTRETFQKQQFKAGILRDESIKNLMFHPLDFGTGLSTDWDKSKILGADISTILQYMEEGRLF